MICKMDLSVKWTVLITQVNRLRQTGNKTPPVAMATPIT